MIYINSLPKNMVNKRAKILKKNKYIKRKMKAKYNDIFCRWNIKIEEYEVIE